MVFTIEKDENGIWVLYDGKLCLDMFDTKEEAEKEKSFLIQADEIEEELKSRLEELLRDKSGEFLKWLRNYYGSKIELELRG